MTNTKFSKLSRKDQQDEINSLKGQIAFHKSLRVFLLPLPILAILMVLLSFNADSPGTLITLADQVAGPLFSIPMTFLFTHPWYLLVSILCFVLIGYIFTSYFIRSFTYELDMIEIRQIKEISELTGKHFDMKEECLKRRIPVPKSNESSLAKVEWIRSEPILWTGTGMEMLVLLISLSMWCFVSDYTLSIITGAVFSLLIPIYIYFGIYGVPLPKEDENELEETTPDVDEGKYKLKYALVPLLMTLLHGGIFMYGVVLNRSGEQSWLTYVYIIVPLVTLGLILLSLKLRIEEHRTWKRKKISKGF